MPRSPSPLREKSAEIPNVQKQSQKYITSTKSKIEGKTGTGENTAGNDRENQKKTAAENTAGKDRENQKKKQKIRKNQQKQKQIQPVQRSITKNETLASVVLHKKQKQAAKNQGAEHKEVGKNNAKGRNNSKWKLFLLQPHDDDDMFIT